MAHRTKAATLAASIVQKMTEVGRWQQRFVVHLIPLLLSLRGRYNFTNLARYGKYHEATYRRNFAKPFDWLGFNLQLVEQYLSADRIIALDPSYITKSGKHSAGVGYFWSGSAGQTKWGQEFCGLAAVDLRDKTALHLLAVQTTERVKAESLLDYYASMVTINADRLRRVSTYVVADAYFAKASFAESILGAGLQLNTRSRKDQVLYYLYQGPRRKGPGAPKRYAGRVEAAKLREDVFTPCAVAEDGAWRAFEAVVYVKAWKRKARVVVIQRYDSQGNYATHPTLASTDLAQSGADLVLSYTSRFQQEFLYRDAKQELGLEDAQAYCWQKIDFHLNASLTTVSIAKAAHCLTPGQPHDQPFSMADLKTEYINERLALRIIRGCGLSPDSPTIRKLLPKIRQWGKRTA